MSEFYNNVFVHDSWTGFFSDSILHELISIEKHIVGEFNPQIDQVLRFASTDIEQLKVVIIGQDPYPQRGIPTGRSFEVSNLRSWEEKFPQSSLRNILRALYKLKTGQTKTISEIRREIYEGSFAVIPPNQLFNHWEKQGVLMLNTYFTCRIGKPGSHREIWGDFIQRVIKYITFRNPQSIWFLWGKEAQKLTKYLMGAKTYICDHPMMAGKKSDSDFLMSQCFIETSKLLDIDWVGF